MGAPLGCTGVEGTYRATCEAFMSILKANEEIPFILSAIVADPFMDWMKTMASNSIEKTVQEVENKLKGHVTFGTYFDDERRGGDAMGMSAGNQGYGQGHGHGHGQLGGKKRDSGGGCDENGNGGSSSSSSSSFSETGGGVADGGADAEHDTNTAKNQKGKKKV